jgi:hypothetical protein
MHHSELRNPGPQPCLPLEFQSLIAGKQKQTKKFILFFKTYRTLYTGIYGTVQDVKCCGFRSGRISIVLPDPYPFQPYVKFQYCIQHCFICYPSDSTASENAGIEPRTFATSALAVSRSKFLLFKILKIMLPVPYL